MLLLYRQTAITSKIVMRTNGGDNEEESCPGQWERRIVKLVLLGTDYFATGEMWNCETELLL
jgi:hypothetical protein